MLGSAMQVPRIGFNMFFYRDTRVGGMFYYAMNMLRELARKVPERLVLFGGRHLRNFVQGIDGLEKVSTRQIADASDIFDYRHEFDVLFTPAFWGGVSMLDYPTIHVIPDIQEQYHPEFFSSSELSRRRVFQPWAAISSTLLITISNFSKSTILEKFGVAAEKVRVTHLAAHPIFSDEREQGIRPTNMPDAREFLFYPANSWNHKNHRGLLDALVELRERYGWQVPAILSGHLLSGEFNHFDIPTEIRARNLQDHVFHIGRTDLRALKYLYSNAVALVHPSLFEGFGIPLVEAMSSGCSIIAARATSIPEVCGDSALYFDPHDHVDIAEKIKHVLENPAQADARRRLGQERARRYSDEKTADQTLEIIREAYELVAEKAAEKRIWASSANLPTPVLSVFISAGEMDSPETCAELARLRSEMPNFIQLIQVYTNASESPSDAGLLTESGCFEDGGDMRAALDKAVETAKGRYFFFVEGPSIPLRSFIYYLVEKEAIEAPEELLYGDSYTKHPKSGRIRDRIPIAEEHGDAVNMAYCSSLAFVVRSDVFRRFLKESGGGWSSFQQMALLLWPYCKRKRVYRIVNCVITSSGDLDWLWAKVKDRFPSDSSLGRFLGTPFGRCVATQMFRIYRVMPETVQQVVSDGLRAALHLYSSFPK